MARKSIEELLWQKLDGELGAQEGRELEVCRAEQPEEVEKEERELEHFSALLAGVEDVEPPEALRGRIDWALTARWASASRSPRLGLRSVRYAYLAAGLVLGIVGAHLLSPGLTPREPDVSQLAGTLSPGAVAPDKPAVVLELGESRGSLALSRDGDLLLGELSLERETESELVVSGGSLRLEHVENPAGLASQVVVEGDRVVLRVAGAGRYFLGVTVTEAAARIHLSLSVAGETPLERQISLADLPEAR